MEGFVDHYIVLGLHSGEEALSVQLDKERVLKVSWETVGERYTAGRLREVFSEFGEVEDVVIRSTKKKCSALVVMATKDGARSAETDSLTAKKSAEAEPQGNIVGAGYDQAFEDEVMQRLRKAAMNQK